MKSYRIVGVILVSVLCSHGELLYASGAKNDENLEALIETILMHRASGDFASSIVKTAMEKHKPNLNEKEFEYFKKEVEKIIDLRLRAPGGYMDQLKRIYSEFYTEEEIEEALAFFRTGTGAKYIESEKYISEEISNSSPIWTEVILKDIDGEVEKALESSRRPSVNQR